MKRLTRTIMLLALIAAPCRAEDFLFAVTTDYETSGQTARVELETPWSPQTNLEPIGSDPVVRSWRNKIYVINRLFADDVQVLDPGAGYDTVLEFSVGAGSNPQDIAFVDDARAYVSRYESVWLYEVNPSTGAITDSIDLGAFADADGLPEMAQMAVWDGHLFVQLQRIDRGTWTPVPPAYLAVIDLATNALVDADRSSPGVQAIPLAVTNPSGPARLDEGAGKMYVGGVGAYLVNDGGVERIDLATLSSDGIVATEAQLGGDLGVFALAGGKGFATVSNDFFFTTRVVSFDLAAGTLLDTLYTTDGYIPDMECDMGTSHLFVADRKVTAPGVHVFDTGSGARLTPAPISVGLPPADLEIVRGVEAGVDHTAASEMMRLGRGAWAEPNPVRGDTRLFFRASGSAASTATIYDIRGRVIRELVGAESAANGYAFLSWDGRDRNGRVAPPGTYFSRIETDEGVRSAKILVVR